MENSDVLIIGSGAAALKLANMLHRKLNVIIFTKSHIRTANSYLAQGGIAAALGRFDHPSKHIADTLEAGRYHNDAEAVGQIINEAPALIMDLLNQGDFFDKNQQGELLLGMEGAHCEKRIVHSGGDATGKNLMEYLIGHVDHRVKIEEFSFAYELIINEETGRCIGVKTKKQDGTIDIHYGSHVVIASGGCGQIYSYTSSAETVTGDGIAMAYLAGAEIADMEFVQFHPTLLSIHGKTKGLVSEAVRGEGGILAAEDGTPIMEGVHPLKDLAPRHVVSQTIYEYIKQGRNVFLDITKIKNFSSRFPTVTSLCKGYGLDLEKGRIPVAPGCHFLMGGIKTDIIGRTSIPGLYAIGEAACTGLHGANRLASNSLLEGLFMGKKLAEWINSADMNPVELKHQRKKQEPVSRKDRILLPDIGELKRFMMDRVGIVRSKEQLVKQKTWLEQFKVTEIKNWDSFSVSDLTKIFMVTTAGLVTNSAIMRTESRGGHFRSDFPFENDNWLQKTIIHKNTLGEENRHEHVETALTY